MEITDTVLHQTQEKIGNAMSNLAESHTLGMLETCEQLAAFTDDGVATLDVLMKLKIKRCIDGRFDVKPDIVYDYKKRVKDSLGWITVIDPNPDLPGMDEEASEGVSAPSDESDVVEPDIVDDSEEQESQEMPEESDDRPALPSAPKLLDAAPEKEQMTVTREAFIARLTSLPKPHELMRSEAEKFFDEVLFFEDLSPEVILNVMGNRESLENMIKEIKTELYTRHEPEEQTNTEAENESQELPKKKRGRRKKDAPDEPSPVPPETPETAEKAPDLPVSEDDTPPASDDASDTPELPSDAERCEKLHPSGVRCCLKKGHDGNCCMTQEDRKIADEWEKKNRKK